MFIHDHKQAKRGKIKEQPFLEHMFGLSKTFKKLLKILVFI